MHHDTTRTGDLNIAKMKIVASLGEKSWKSWVFVVARFC